MRKSIVSLSIATFTGSDRFRAMPLMELVEEFEAVREVYRSIGKK